MSNANRLARFHDAELRLVCHRPEDDVLELRFAMADGEFARVSLSGVTAFRVTDMRMQNVVSRLMINGWNFQLPRDEIHENVRWISETCEGEQLARPAKLEDIVGKVISGEKLLFILEPACGAEMKAVIADVIFEAESQDA
jgi:hypothetical protein